MSALVETISATGKLQNIAERISGISWEQVLRDLDAQGNAKINRLLTADQGGDVNAFVGSYSPDGRWIVFRLEDHGSFGLYKMRSDGSGLRPILGLSGLKPRFIDWGPHSGSTEDEDN